ncbi:MAG: pyridoxamine 5'-phosphate oxidase family protein [Pyrinomonadaceae bacterium]
MLKRMRSYLILVAFLLLTCSLVFAQKPLPKDAREPYKVDDEKTLLESARSLMIADKYAALITVDDDGIPRARTVVTQLGTLDLTRPDKGLTVWILTRRSTRKIEQIKKNPKVTLYYNDDAKESYVTLMGTATIYTDPNNPEAKKFYTDEQAKYFWPDLKKDFAMISVKPMWMEVLIWPTIKNHPDNWRPQAVVFKY